MNPFKEEGNDVEKAKKKLQEVIPGNENYVATYGVIKSDGTYVNDGNHSCHAGLRDRSWVGAKKILNAVQKLQVDDKLATSFYEWLLNYSPWAPIFESKDAKTVLSERVSVIRTDVPAVLVGGGLMATRAITEHTGFIAKVWWNLVKNGCHPTIAFAYAHVFRTQKEPETLVYQPMNWHCSLDGSSMDDYFVNFGVGKPVKSSKNFDEVGCYPMTIHATWSGKAPTSLSIRKDINTTLTKSIKKVKSTKNPFCHGGEIESNEKVKFNEGVEFLGNYLRDAYKGVVN